MSRTCARVWEVSAARDGRLGAAAASALEGHIERCDDCRRERDALEAVREQLQGATAGELDDLSLRRLRARTLEAAGNARLAPARSSRPVVLLLAGALALGAIALVARPSPHVPTVRATDVTTTDEGGARWSAHEDVESRRIVLREGKVRLAVDRPAGGKRLVVEVPDGEIEDVGTTFHVEVSDGHTRRVHVDEGSVVLRLDGQPSIALAHGETWEASPRVAVEPPVIAPSAAAPPAPSARPAPRASASAVASASPARREVDDAGPEEEDRAYVEVVRLLREGREHEARTAAVVYLRRFPSGFRRAEVEKVLAP